MPKNVDLGSAARPGDRHENVQGEGKPVPGTALWLEGAKNMPVSSPSHLEVIEMRERSPASGGLIRGGGVIQRCGEAKTEAPG